MDKPGVNRVSGALRGNLKGLFSYLSWLFMGAEFSLSEAQTLLNSSQKNGQDPLQELREELDQIDRRLVTLLVRRLEHCDRIGEIKREHGIPMMQPHRIEVVLRKTAGLAEQMGVNPNLVTDIYRLIIAETCRREDLIIGHL